MKASKAKARAKKGERLRQVAALPYRLDEAGEPKLLLVTSRATRRFVIPKGWPMKKFSDAEAAAREAKQEAGVVGTPARKPVGSYFYWKRMKNVFVPVDVDVYPLVVERELSGWREKRQRAREWVTFDQAAALVDEPRLIEILAAAKESLRP